MLLCQSCLLGNFPCDQCKGLHFLNIYACRKFTVKRLFMSSLKGSSNKVMPGKVNHGNTAEGEDTWQVTVSGEAVKVEQQEQQNRDVPHHTFVDPSVKEDQRRNEDKGAGNCGLCNRYTKFMFQITNAIDTLFEKLAKSLVKHPLIWISVAFLFIGLCCAGFARFSSESRTEKLYVPQGSQAEKDQDKVKVHFNTLDDTRLEEFGFFRRGGGNFMTQVCVQEALDLINEVMNIPDLNNLCIKKAAYLPRLQQYNNKTVCSILNPFELLTSSNNSLQEFNRNLKNTRLMMSNGKLPIYNENDMIAKVIKNSGNITSIEVLRVQMYLKNDDKPTDSLEWEKKFIDLMKKREKSLKCANVLYSAQRSLDDAISESAGGDIAFVSIAFTIMLTFANVMLGKFTNPLRGHSLLAAAGVLSTGLGIGAGFGLSLATGTPFVSIVGVLPFLVLSIGIDDMFIIVDEFDKQLDDIENAVTCVPKAMRKIGATITMTTLTDITAFAVSVSSDFPAIRYFCAFAAITFTVEFILQVTLFVVFLYFDARRIKAGRRECLPCCTGKDEAVCCTSFGKENVSNSVARKYAEYLMKWQSKVAVLLIGAGLLAFGVYGCFHVSQEFSRTSLVKDGSHLLTYLDKIENDFDKGLPVNIYKFGAIDYSSPQIQSEISSVPTAALSTGLYKSEYVSWLKEYQNWSQSKGINIEGANFTRHIRTFMFQPLYAHFFLDVKFNSQGQIVASRTRISMKPTKISTEQRDAMKSIREEFEKRGILLTPYADNFIYFEQFAAVVGEVTRNIIVAAAAVLIITLPFCINPVIVLLLLFGFASLITELIGLMYFWDVSLNSISMINLVMSIGFAIDYSAHVAHAFIMSSKESVNERVIEAISSIGASVFMGGASTFLGMLATSLTASEIFRIFFRMMLGIVVFGLFNGLMLLPVLFSLFGCMIGRIRHD